MKNKSVLLAVAAVIFLCACAHRPPPASDGAAEDPGRGDAAGRLETDLAGMLGYRDKEAALLARAALSGTERLARLYDVQPPAHFHNFLVNLGIKDRGLCCHWTQDLLAIFQALGLQKYTFVWAVCRHGSIREHNSVVVTATGRPFASGIVLDPWRNAGELYWSAVDADVYAWQPHPDYVGAGSVECSGDRRRKQARLSPPPDAPQPPRTPAPGLSRTP
jgi:hypothetical protein